jgi:hypothetical protein
MIYRKARLLCFDQPSQDGLLADWDASLVGASLGKGCVFVVTPLTPNTVGAFSSGVLPRTVLARPRSTVESGRGPGFYVFLPVSSFGGGWNF